MTPSPPYSQLDELDAHLPDDVIEQVAKLAYLLHAELREWQAPRSLVAQAVAKAATRGWRLADNDQLIGDPAVARLAHAVACSHPKQSTLLMQGWVSMVRVVRGLL